MYLKKIIGLFYCVLISIAAFSQPTHQVTDPEKMFKEAKEYFMQEQYALAYPLLSALQAQTPENSASDHAYLNDDLNYYYIVCELKLNLPRAESAAKQYIDLVNNEPRRKMLSYALAKFYFTKEDFGTALGYYEKSGLANLSPTDLADAKFEKAYCYFNAKLYAEAKPLFDEVRELADNKYYFPANYYFGYISFYDKDYTAAMQAFKLVQNEPAYKGIVPYYIAEILCFQKKYDEALKYTNEVLEQGGPMQFEKELKLLQGQLYFEKKDFASALPILKTFADSNDNVNNEILYELSYAYYQDHQCDKAIEGFKKLSTEKDSLGLNSMYLLGDCYLQTGQKEEALKAFQYCAENLTNEKQKQVSRFTYAKLLYETGKEDEALSIIKTYLSDYPKSDFDEEAKQIMLVLQTNAHHYAAAMELYESVKKPNETMQALYPRILLGRGIELMNEDQSEKADSLFSKMTQLPDSSLSPYANFYRGELAYRNKSYDYAIRYLSFYQQANPPAIGEANAKNAAYNLGYSWFQKEQYAKALSYFEQVTLTVSPTSSFIEQDAFLRSADCYFMQKNFSKSGDMYETAINNALPQSDYAYYQKAILAGIKNSTEKIKVLNSLSHLYPESSLIPQAQMEIADTYIADEKFAEAIPYLVKLLNLENEEAWKPAAYLKTGLSYYNINNNKQALKYYLDLIDQFPESQEAAQALDNVKNIYVEEGTPNEYVNLMQKTGKEISVPEADSLTYNAALLKYNANNNEAAIAGFENYLKQFPTGSFALPANYFKSECYDKNKEWEKALEGYDYVSSKGINKYFERSAGEAARISYFELKDYAAAKKYFAALIEGSNNPELQLGALRGLVRCYNLMKDYSDADEAAQQLIAKKGASADDKAIAFLVLGKSGMEKNNFPAAISAFSSLAAINKAAWGAEARYEIAHCQFLAGNLSNAEKSATAALKDIGAYDEWLTRTYILLGDIFMAQKDYFNARVTYESVAKNSVNMELKKEAQAKLEEAIAKEQLNTKNNN